MTIPIVLTVSGQNTTQNDSLMNVKSKEPNFGWWYKGQKADKISNEWTISAEILQKAVESDPVLKDVYVNIFGNSYNNTMFVVLTNITPEITQKIISVIPSQRDVTIKFVKGNAPDYMLEYYLNQKINVNKLKKLGVPLSAIGKTENGTILIGIEKVTHEYVKIIQKQLEDKVPLDLIIIREMPAIVLNEYDHKQRPLKAGVEVGAYKSPSKNYATTLNFLVTEVGDSQDWAIISGHAETDGEGVWQPSSRDDDDYIGDSQDTNNIGGKIGRYSDSALVQVEDGVSACSVVYGPSYDVYVVGQKNYAQQQIGAAITMVGKVSGYRGGTIQAKFSAVGHSKYTWINNTLSANYYATFGDSGAPILQMWYEDGIWKTYAWGIHVGTTGNTRYYSPPDGIETDFNKNFDFSGT